MIEDVLRKYARDEPHYLRLIKDELTTFTNNCSDCIDTCIQRYDKGKCFEQYLVDLGYKPIERRKKDEPVVVERRKPKKK